MREEQFENTDSFKQTFVYDVFFFTYFLADSKDKENNFTIDFLFK